MHAKLTIIDDTLLRIGSSNINNRSFGFDTECDLCLEATGPGAAANRAEIIRLRNKLLAHWLGCVEQPMEGHPRGRQRRRGPGEAAHQRLLPPAPD